MRETFLQLQSDLEWLKETHIPDLPDSVICAIIFGNEDCPDRVEASTSYFINRGVVYHYARNESFNLIEVGMTINGRGNE